MVYYRLAVLINTINTLVCKINAKHQSNRQRTKGSRFYSLPKCHSTAGERVWGGRREFGGERERVWGGEGESLEGGEGVVERLGNRDLQGSEIAEPRFPQRHPSDIYVPSRKPTRTHKTLFEATP